MAKKQPNNKTEVQTAGLTGPVKSVMQICYRAHLKEGEVVPGKIEVGSYPHRNFIAAYDEQGAKTSEQRFQASFITTDTYSNGLKVHSRQLKKDGSVYRETTHTYNEQGNLLESLITDAEGKTAVRRVETYDEEGKPRCTLPP